MKNQRRAACLLLAVVSILVLGAIWDFPDYANQPQLSKTAKRWLN
jgi:hypothetical protein